MILRIIRGLPGSGKSTLAKQMSSFVHVEADMFFDVDGKYVFDPSKIKLAHEWCQSQTKKLLSQGRNVVVSNTFTQRWEIFPYKKLASEAGATFEVVHAVGNFGNVHGVPEEKIRQMAARWESWG